MEACHLHRYEFDDVMWERLKDSQRELEARRTPTVSSLAALANAIRLLGKRTRLIAGLAAKRVPRGRSRITS